ncbi:MAG: Outer rane fibronectin-binding protein [Labilithrix sp.]|nr:Outer rane fibronectin-binding protein [Labilithrix sp.]
MSFNIIEVIESQVTPERVEGISKATGESPVRARQGISAGILAIVSGVIHRSSSPSGAAGLLETLRSPFGSRTNLASSLLGDRTEQLTDAVAKTSGISRPAASGIMGALLPLVASVLGREVLSRKLDAGGLAEMMRSQKEKLVSQPGLPTAFAGMLGLRKAPEIVRPELGAAEIAKRTAAPVGDRSAKKSRSWLPLALVLGAVGLGAIFLARRATTPTTEVEPTAEAPRVETPYMGTPQTEPQPAPAPGGTPVGQEPVGQTTVTGAELPKDTGDLSVHFEAKDVPDRMTLSDVTFDFGTAKLNTGEDTVDHLATLMKQHPSARVRLEGHTDNVGDANVNDSLSQKRAVAVRKLLVDKGVDSGRIEAVGRGAAEPISPNTTDEGRAKNRRIDAVIVGR